MLGCSPAAPEISLEPAEPTSIEDLFLKAESEHGLRVEWFVDRLPAAIDGMTVPASMTTRGEQWGVRVTPNLREAGGGALDRGGEHPEHPTHGQRHGGGRPR